MTWTKKNPLRVLLMILTAESKYSGGRRGKQVGRQARTHSCQRCTSSDFTMRMIKPLTKTTIDLFSSNVLQYNVRLRGENSASQWFAISLLMILGKV